MKTEKRDYWFYLDSYVHVTVKADDVLVYNPLNGAAVVERGCPEAAALLNRLTSDENLYVIKLTAEELNKEEISRLVSRVREGFMGDLIDADRYKGKPFQVPPKLKIMKGIEKHPDQVSGNKGNRIIGNLSSLSIYLNNSGAQLSSSFPADAYKQFAAPCFGGTEPRHLEPGPLLKLLAEAETSLLERVNILGGDIFDYRYLPLLQEALNRMPVYKAYYVYYPQLEGRNLAEYNLQGELDVMVDFPVRPEHFAQAVRAVEAAGMHARYQFIIQADADLDAADGLIEKYGFSDFSYMPYFNGENLEFFREGVFVRPEDIVEAQPSQKEILKREIMNTANFGRLTILSNGDIHANVNRPKIGTLGENTLHDVLYEEMNGGNSWWALRSEALPCRDCIYQQLCPPISNYEYVIGRHDLCLAR